MKSYLKFHKQAQADVNRKQEEDVLAVVKTAEEE